MGITNHKVRQYAWKHSEIYEFLVRSSEQSGEELLLLLVHMSIRHDAGSFLGG
jgi:hypothetical protein